MRFKTGLSLLLSLLLSWLSCSPAWSRPVLQTTINAVLGDRSYTERFGTLPTAETHEQLRIQTHLRYVEKLLKSRTPDSITQQLYPRRQHMISLLSQYIQQGIFPSQQAYRGRRPHFIDEQGRLCAVGSLVAKTTGLPLAQKINQRYAYHYLPDMQMPELNSWVKDSGLTVQELAMIQPTYGDQNTRGASQAFGTSLVVVGLLQYVLLAIHVGLFVWATNDNEQSFPAFYSKFQLDDLIITGLSLSLMLILAPFTPSMLQSQTIDINLFMLGIVLPTLFGTPIFNGLLLGELAALAHPHEKVSLGFFETPDQQTCWGLHASLSF